MELSLYVPKLDELWFRQKLLSDPKTMAYNAPWFPPDGCIDFPHEKWAAWHAQWIGHEPQFYYAYLKRTSDDIFIGDVCFRYTPDRDWWDMGIVICAPERGKGYGKQGLKLLIDHAFSHGVKVLHNEFETTREAAYHIHRAVGFEETERQSGVIELQLTEEMVRKQNPPTGELS